MNARQARILQLLHTSGSEFMAAHVLGEMTNLSTRTILRHLKALEAEKAACGFEIEKSRGQGYRLRISDPFLYEAHVSRFLQGRHPFATDAAADMAVQLLLNGCTRLDDLAERQSYSRSSVSRMNAQVSSLLSTFHLQMESKAHRGLQFTGSELCIRAAVAYLLFDDSDLQELARTLALPDFDAPAAIGEVLSLAGGSGLLPDEEKAKNFLKYAMLCAARASGGFAADFDSANLSNGLIVSPDSVNCVSLLASRRKMLWLPEAPDRADILYLALAWEQYLFPPLRFRQKYGLQPDFYRQPVTAAFSRIKTNYKADFSDDKILREGLAQHIAASYGRYLLGMDTDNPYCESLKYRYPVAHYYVLELIEELILKTRMPVFAGEIGFLSMHMASAMERGAGRFKIRAAILCSTAFGTAGLLKSRLVRKFDSIDVFGVYSVEEVKQRPLPVDIYISTVPFGGGSLHGKPMLTLSPFFDEADAGLLESALADMESGVPIRDYFPQENFFIIERPSKKDAVLHLLCDELIARGSIGPGDKESIFAREALVSTEITPLAAMPHCIVNGKSQLAFALLQKPVLWKRNKIRLIMIGFFQKGDDRIKQLLTRLFRVMEDDGHVEALLKCGCYEEFAGLLESLTGGDKIF